MAWRDPIPAPPRPAPGGRPPPLVGSWPWSRPALRSGRAAGSFA